MKSQLVTVCIFCLLCATHSHCSSQHSNIDHSLNISSLDSVIDIGKGKILDDGGGGMTESDKNSIHKEDAKKGLWTDGEKLDSNDFISVVFQKFGDGKTISHEGFEKLLVALGLGHLIDHANSHTNLSASRTDDGSWLGVSNDSWQNLPSAFNLTSVSSDNLLGAKKDVNKDLYKAMCPILLYQYLQLSTSACSRRSVNPHSHIPVEQTKNIYSVWLYATLSIIMISLCGLGGVVVIPVMQKVFYQKLLQFLVALAVGTLCGDALLHLLPHAMLPRHSHSVPVLHTPGSSSHSFEVAENHDTNMWLGLVAMFGIIFLYFTEKGLTFIADCRKAKQRKKQAMPRVKLLRDGENTGLVANPGTVGEKLCKHKYSSYPYCYGEITESGDAQKNLNEVKDGSEAKNLNDKSCREENGTIMNTKQYTFTKSDKGNVTDCPASERELLNGEKESDLNETPNNEESFTIIIREHENAHHGHSHTHGHVHAAPTSLSSVAWMVIMGDGLHNFADGMAIGAAFATNISGGFSTALAVFFHELPHELGDFAVLLQAGMSAKQAVFYNLLSSILCFVGMCLGVFLGHDESTTQWVFSGAAGMFLYIALVDMIPELTTSHSKEEDVLCQCLLHFAGLMCGVGTMLLIAVYEPELKTVFIE